MQQFKDEKDLILFYQKHKRQLISFINRQIGDYQIAEELVQDVFLDFFDNLTGFRGESSVETYLFAIARHKTIDYIRKKKIKQILFSTLPLKFIEKATSFVFDDELEKKALATKIEKVLNRLPNDYAVIIRLKYIDGEKIRSIAQKLSLSLKATESLLFRARQAFIKVFQSLP
jgi:RNA polymerase sigma-70 factor, ECF subfamily